MSQRSHTVSTPACSRGSAVSLAGVCTVLLGACGGGADNRIDAALQRAQAAAAAPVVLEALPALHRCLSALSEQLQAPKRAAPTAMNLDCLVGTYAGKTAQGDECFLRVDATQNRFTFGYGIQRAVIDWTEVALTADGRPVHNLEATDLDAARPGVQLSRFTAVPEALTETLALRAGLAQAGPKGLPQINYQRAPQGGKTVDVECRFAT